MSAVDRAPDDVPPVRLVSLPLMIGLIALPIVFVWLLLRQGYSSSLRRAAFAYAFTIPVLSVFVTIIGAMVGSTP